MNMNVPTVIYHDLNALINRPELDHVATAATSLLDSGHITGIVNAFFVNTKICVNGIPYIKISGLATILRTSNSGAERPLVYQGMKNILSPAQVIEIDGEEHISGPSLKAILDTRSNLTNGRTKQYLNVAMQAYNHIINLAIVRDLKDIFLEDINNNRSTLKTQRIVEFGITHCEFSGEFISSRNLVEFAHIESVITNPMLALNINNGVIILKTIHRELTNRGIHDYKGMYDFCKEFNYSTNWA